MSDDVASEILRAALERIESRRKPIGSTYRLQLHGKFRFGDATAIIPYLARLGITHVYASPYFKAKPGSTHGYDVTDHCRLNPELGTRADYDQMVATLKSRGMHHILDMVPNHVGIGNNDNAWWNDVLENGPASIYADYFDINWTGSPTADLHGRVLVPVLGDLYADELESGNLKLTFDAGCFFIAFNDRRFPISPQTYPMILRLAESDEIKSIIGDCEKLPDRCDGKEVAQERHGRKERIKQSLLKLTGARHAIRRATERFNGSPGDAQSFDRIHELLKRQHFRLAHWRTASDEINYRRFFDISDLAGLAMERREVFDATHVLVLKLLAEDKVAGLRIDHPDGLSDPRQYFEQLQSHFILAVAKTIAVERGLEWQNFKSHISVRIRADNRPLYVAVEKILALDEPLIESWPVSGTTGYEFLNYVNGLFVDASAADKFSSLYSDFIDNDASCVDLIYDKKKLVLDVSFASELDVLTLTLKRIAEQDRYGVDFSLTALRSALKEVIACFPVYRSYISPIEISDTDRKCIRRALKSAAGRNPRMPRELFDFIEHVLVGEAPSDDLNSRRYFAAKFQQLTAPVTAKGIEDTTFYIYNRLLSLNEVGGDPSRFGISPDDLHAFFGDRQQRWPNALSALSTHDTKRSEDVRARLNALSEIPDEWRACLCRWRDLNARFVVGRAPDPNEQYALYQTLLGAWPITEHEETDFEERIQACTLKSMREAKVNTGWTDPNAEHEAAVANFIHAILNDGRAQAFRDDFRTLQKRISGVGVVNSLAQTLIKLTAPGIPDTYQGTESWDLSLVDPDNRRPVDFAARARMLNAIDEGIRAHDLRKSVDDGRAKALVHATALRLRAERPTLFSSGEYLPLKSAGKFASHLFAFARKLDDEIAITVVPRLTAGLFDWNEAWVESDIWSDTQILLPDAWTNLLFLNLFTGTTQKLRDGSDLLRHFPVALLHMCHS